MTQEYYIEKVDGSEYNFNIWEKNGDRYFSVATLFYQDRLCGTQWTVTDKTKAVSYSEDEIQDEIESPLRSIPVEKAQSLLKLTSVRDVLDSLEGILG